MATAILTSIARADPGAGTTESWSEDLLQRSTLTGGDGPTPFNTVAPTSHLVKKITFWRLPAQKKHVQSLSQVKIEYTDGSSQTYGSPKGDLQEYDFNPGQKITQASAFGNGSGSRTGRIKWKSDSGPDFDFGMPSTSGQTEFSYDIGSGFLVGIEGEAGDEINCLALIFLKQGIDIKADPPSYDTSVLKNIQATIAHEQTFAWDGSPYEYKFGPDSSEITVTNSWSTTTSSSFGASIGISYSPIPGFLTMSADFSYSYSSETTKSGSTTTDDKVSWERSGKIASKKDAMVLRCMYGQFSGEIPFTCKMTMTSKDGKTMTWTESGTAKQKMTTTVDIQAFEIDGKTPKVDKDEDDGDAEGSEEEAEESGEEVEQSGEEEEDGSEPAASDAEEEPEEDDDEAQASESGVEEEEEPEEGDEDEAEQPEESGGEEEESEEDETENASGEGEEAEASQKEEGSEQEEEEAGTEEEDEDEEEPAPPTKGKAKPNASKAKPTIPVTKGKK